MQTRLAAVLPVLIASASAQTGWPYSMDYGPALMTTFSGGGLCGTVEKGLVIRLGEGAAVAFDTELLRMAVAWDGGWLRLRGTAYDGAHGPFPSRRGQALAETRVGPGWYNGQATEDPRPIPHGPLPTAWGRYGGQSLVGEQVVVDYRIDDMQVRELYALEQRGVPVVLRTLELGPSKNQQTLVVLDGPKDAGTGSATSGAQQMAVLQWQPESPGRVEYEGTTAGWQSLSLGAPAADDYLANDRCRVTFVDGFATPHGKSESDSSLPLLRDGKGASNEDDWKGSVWFDKHKVNKRNTDHGRYLVDLGEPIEISRIHTYSWHKGNRAVQRYTVYGSDGADPTARDLGKAGWQRIAEIDSSELGQGDKHCVAIADKNGLGKFRNLLFDCRKGGTFFSEVDVHAGDKLAMIDREGRTARNLMVVSYGSKGPKLSVQKGRITMHVPVHDKPLRVMLAMAACDNDKLADLTVGLMKAREVAAIPTGHAKPRWTEAITTKGVRGADDGPFAVDTITIPFENPYGSRMRTGAFDFFSDGRAAVSTWNGDVWVVSGIDADLDQLEWRRFATGLFDPLGLRIVDDVVYVHGRDGLTRLLDTNSDGEADRYENFNNQVYITAAFHEFAFDLQTDADGNFYFSKGAPVNPGGRGFMKIVPHHGTILKVSKDGSSIEPIATGMRAPNGIGVSPTGIVTSGDNEGTYMPRCRLNWIEKPGFYAGVKDTAHRSPVPEQPMLPLCWMPMEVDNSSGGQVWVTGKGWPDLQGRCLHNSYGKSSTYLVLPERVDGQIQGGVVRLPANYTSSAMRGRFSPIDGQLYTIGLKGWQTNAARDGGFHRVRRTGRPLDLPIALRTCDEGVYLTFSCKVDAEIANDPESYSIEVWNYRYSQNYGSPEVSVLDPERKRERGKSNRDPLKVEAATLSPDGTTVFLKVGGMRPVHQMKITWDLDSQEGRPLRGELHNSIHALAKNPGFPKGE